MASFNSVTLIGNLTRDVEVRMIGSGTAVADVSLAVNEKWTDKQGEKKESVAFIDCTLWGKTAELAGQYLAKGSPVLFAGKLVQDTWEDKESGAKRSKIKVKVETMQFLSGPPSGDKAARPSGKAPHATQYEEYDATPDEAATPF